MDDSLRKCFAIWKQCLHRSSSFAYRRADGCHDYGAIYCAGCTESFVSVVQQDHRPEQPGKDDACQENQDSPGTRRCDAFRRRPFDGGQGTGGGNHSKRTVCDSFGKEEGEAGKRKSAAGDFQLFQWSASEGRRDAGQTTEPLVRTEPDTSWETF